MVKELAYFEPELKNAIFAVLTWRVATVAAAVAGVCPDV
jgi:hypothetical protein